MNSSLLFSITWIATQPLAEYLLYKKLNRRGLDIRFALFSFDPRFSKETTDSIVRPISFSSMQNDAIKISDSKFNLLKSRSLYYILKDINCVLTRHIGKGTDWLIPKAIRKQKHSISHIVYVMNTVGANVGAGQPDIYLSPGKFWTQLLVENKSFLTGLKKYHYPFITKEEKFNGIISNNGLLASLEIEDSINNINKEDVIKAYDIKDKYIVFCLEASSKYIDGYGNHRGPFFEWTINILEKIKEFFGDEYEILIKGHPFHYEKPYPWYDRKQIDINLFSKYGKIVRANDGYHTFRFAEFVITGNSSVAYEVALCGSQSVVIANQESDYYLKDGIFRGGFFTPEFLGYTFKDWDDFVHNYKTLKKGFSEKEKQIYLENYCSKFDLEKLINLIKAIE